MLTKFRSSSFTGLAFRKHSEQALLSIKSCSSHFNKRVFYMNMDMDINSSSDIHGLQHDLPSSLRHSYTDTLIHCFSHTHFTNT